MKLNVISLVCRFSLRSFLLCGSLLAMLTGCRSVPIQPPMNLAEPGWTIRQGQAAWSPKPGALDIAGDLAVAMHPDGRSLVQFTKPPLPFVVAQRHPGSWQIQFFAEEKTYSGRGTPPDRLMWLHLPDGIAGDQRSESWHFISKGEGTWTFENRSSGETLEGFLATTTLPEAHVVRPGETLPRIARWYGLAPGAIEAANPGPGSGWLKPGSVIRLPPPLQP
jgi:hypothetical protein